MRIALTNDDGYDSPGLAVLKNALADEHDVWVVAPDRDRSGISHAVTAKGSVKVSRRDTRGFALSGTPVDCVLYAWNGLMPEKPEVVLSGINLGPNLSPDIIFSGTAAAARQGAYLGIPGIAVSINSFLEPFYFGYAAEFIRKNIVQMAKRWDGEYFYNINFPNIEKPGFIALGNFENIPYRGKLDWVSGEKREGSYRYTGIPMGEPASSDSDWGIVSRGGVSVSAVHYLGKPFRAGPEAEEYILP